jgi:hypothetical protein
LLHDTKPVATPYLSDVFDAVTAAEQLTGKLDKFTGIGNATYTAISIKVGA